MEKYSVEAVLSAVDKGFTGTVSKAVGLLGKLTGANSDVGRSTSGIFKSMLGAQLVGNAMSSAFGMVTGGVREMASELTSSKKAWSVFEGNMQMLGKSSGEIGKAKSAMQDYATKTIYSASEMASTYSQLAAVGIKETDKLVTGFGGLAAASENPKQAMKTLSQQATQMAAKPKVAWQDFKLMLEQTPAGLSAVADAMGMTTAELVKAVQDGEVSTEAFFDAIKKVGNSDAFTKMATQFKSVGQAIDGAKETLSNKLLPAFEKLDGFGIKVVEALTNRLEGLDFGKLADKLGAFLDGINIDGTIDKIIGSVSGLVANLGTIAPAGIAAFSAFQGLGLVKPLFDTAIGATGSLISAVGQVPSVMSNVAQVGISTFTNIGTSIAGVAGKVPILKSAMSGVGGSFTAVSQKVAGLASKFPLLSQGASMAGQGISSSMNIGMKSAGMLTSSIGQLAMAGLSLVGPVALVGAGIAAAGVAMVAFGDQISGVLQTAITQGPQIISSFVDGIISYLPGLMMAGTQMIAQLGTAIATNVPVIIQKGVDLIVALVQGVQSNLPQLLSTAIEVITSFVTSIISAVPQLMMAGMQFILALVQGVMGNMGNLLSSANTMLTSFISALSTYLPQIISTGIEIIVSLIEGVSSNLPAFLEMATQALTQFIQVIVSNLPNLINGGIRIIQSLIKGIIQNIPAVAKSAGNIIKSLLSAIGKALPQLLTSGIKIVFELVKGLIQAIPALVSAAGELAMSVVDGIKQGIADFGQGIWDGLKDGWNNLFGGAKETVAEATESISSDVQTMADNVNHSTSNMTTKTGINFDKMQQEMIAKTEAGVYGTKEAMAGIEGAEMPMLNCATNAIEHMTNMNIGVTEQSAQASANVQANTSQVGTFAEFYHQLNAGAQAYLGEYDAVVDLMTAETANTAFSNTEQVMSMLDWYNALPEWTRQDLEAYGITVDTMTASTAQTAVANTEQVASAAEYYAGLADGATDAVTTLNSNVTSQMSSASSNVSTNSQEIETAKTHYETLRDVSTSALEHMAAQINFIYGKLSQDVERHSMNMTAKVTQRYNEMNTKAETTMQKMVSMMTSKMNTIKSKVTSAFSNMTNTVSNGMSRMVSSMTSGFSQAVSATQSAMNSVTSAMNSTASGAYTAGYNTGIGFYNGLAATAGSIYSLASSIAANVAATIRSALSIHSPSRVMAKLGGFTGEGFALGLSDTIDHTNDVAEKLAHAAMPEMGKMDTFSELEHINNRSKYRGYRHTNSEMTAKQPLELNVTIGGSDWRLFIEDIMDTQASVARLRRV